MMTNSRVKKIEVSVIDDSDYDQEEADAFVSELPG